MNPIKRWWINGGDALAILWLGIGVIVGVVVAKYDAPDPDAIWHEAYTAGYLHGEGAERARHGPSDQEIWDRVFKTQELRNENHN